MYIYTDEYIHIYILYANVSKCVYRCISLYTYVYIYIYIHIYNMLLTHDAAPRTPYIYKEYQIQPMLTRIIKYCQFLTKTDILQKRHV